MTKTKKPPSPVLIEQTQEVLDRVIRHLSEDELAIELSNLHLMDDEEAPSSRAA